MVLFRHQQIKTVIDNLGMKITQTFIKIIAFHHVYTKIS